MGNLYGKIGESTPASLLADPIGAIRKAIAVTLGNGALTSGTVMVRGTGGLYAPATSDTLIAGVIAAILADDVDTGSVTAGTALAATAWFRGRFLRGKVKLAAGELPAAKYGVLNGMGIMLEEFIPAAGAEATFDNVLMDTVAMPTATPGAGAVASGTQVTLATATSGAKIYYTTDGSTPTAGSTEYTAPIAMTAAKTIKVIAVKSGMHNSAVMSAAYTIQA